MEESTSSPEQPLCQVCAQPSQGNHFGAVTCRACSAFFRRASSSKTKVKPCKKDGRCQKLLNNQGWFDCKFCRLQKCCEVGMSCENFQFDRDPISTKFKFLPVPKSMESFLGRPHCVIFVEPNFEKSKSKKDLIDCTELLGKAEKILCQGPESPVHSQNSLQKLAEALKKIDETHFSNPMKIVTKYGKEEVLSFFENDFLKATTWFNYFDEFKNLDLEEKILLIQSMWHVWSRLYKLSTAAIGKRRENLENEKLLMISHDEEYTVMDLTKIEFDYSWCTKYSNEQMQQFSSFLDNTSNSFLYKVVDSMIDVKPSEVELAFMMTQSCFHYAGQRFQGHILEICEKFEQKLANELHEFYVDEWRMPNYSGRLSLLLKINNQITDDIWKCRKKQEIAEIFDVYSIEYSHPEIFKDI